MRDLSARAIQSMQDPETGEVWLFLLEINHHTLIQPWRLVNNTENVVSDGQNYVPFPFEIALGDDTGEELPKVKLTIDNIDRDLIQTIRTQAIPPEITVRLVLASQPDVVEFEKSGLTLRELSFDAFTISGTLFSDDILNSRFPADTITLANGYLGLFR